MTGSPLQKVAQIVSVVVVLALLGVLVYKTTHNKVSPLATDVDHGKPFTAYPFSARLVGQPGSISLKGLRGKVVVLNFWQSYCAPCTAEAPVMAKVSKQWASKNVVFVGIDVQDLSGPATKFMRRFDITYPVIPDNGALVGHYGVTGYPETFFINKRGIVVPMPAVNTTYGVQVGHIIGQASPKLLDLGIETAMHDDISKA